MENLSSSVESVAQTAKAKMKKNKKTGLFLLIAPFVGLILTLTIWGITTFVLEATSSDAVQSPSAIVHSIINVVLGFIGIVCVVGIIVGIPMGIIFLNKKEVIPGAKYDERSGQGKSSVVPSEIKGWNWGAAGLT